MGRLKVLGLALLTLVQLALASVLIAYVYMPILFIVGILNLLWKLITGSGFENMDVLLEPAMWYLHQLKVLFGMSEEFRPAPYV